METITPVLNYYLKEATMSFLLVNGFKRDGNFISIGAAMQIEINQNITFNN